MTTSNNATSLLGCETRKKQKRTAVDGDVVVNGDSSSSSTTGIVGIPLLSFGNILLQFPDFRMQLLPYIADRTVFNSIASCNRDTNEKSKAIRPPWPKEYQLLASDRASIAVWSPDGTRVAYRGDDDIIIVDQQHGVIRRIDNNDGTATGLKFSPDGRFLVSVSDKDIVTAWDNIGAGNHELSTLQRWNIKEDFPGIGIRMHGCSINPGIDISACSRYIVMASSRYMENRVIVKSVENGGTVRSLTPQPVMKIIFKVVFSVDYRAVFIYGRIGSTNVIKLWRFYPDDTDEDSLITLWEDQSCTYKATIFSRDKTMLAIHDIYLKKGWLLSIDNNNNYSCLTKQFDLEGNDVPLLLHFTPDNKYIIFAITVGLKYWSVAGGNFTDKEYLLYTIYNLEVMNCSPNNRQLILRDDSPEGDSLYMKSLY